MLTAQTTPDIWIYDYEKKMVSIRRLHEKLQKFTLTDDEKGEFEDDLPAFLMNLSKMELIKIERDIKNNLTSESRAYCKMITIHSYKGMENDTIRVYNDIDIKNEPNLYYVALTRGIKDIHIDENRLVNDSIFIDTSGSSLKIDSTFKMSSEKSKEVTQKNIDCYFNMFSKTTEEETKKPKKKSYERLLDEGKSIVEISKEKGVKVRTVEENIIKLLNNKSVKINWVQINGPDKDVIEQVIECSKDWEDGKFRTLKVKLPEVSYYHIKLALLRR